MTKVGKRQETVEPNRYFSSKIDPKTGKRKVRKLTKGQQAAKATIERQNRYHSNPAPKPAQVLTAAENNALTQGLTGQLPLNQRISLSGQSIPVQFTEAEYNTLFNSPKFQAGLQNLRQPNSSIYDFRFNPENIKGRNFVAEVQSMSSPSLAGRTISDIQAQQKALYFEENLPEKKIEMKKIKNGPNKGKWQVTVNGVQEGPLYNSKTQASSARQRVQNIYSNELAEARRLRRNNQILEQQMRQETKFGNKTVKSDAGQFEATNTKDAKFARGNEVKLYRPEEMASLNRNRNAYNKLLSEGKTKEEALNILRQNRANSVVQPAVNSGVGAGGVEPQPTGNPQPKVELQPSAEPQPTGNQQPKVEPQPTSKPQKLSVAERLKNASPEVQQRYASRFGKGGFLSKLKGKAGKTLLAAGALYGLYKLGSAIFGGDDKKADVVKEEQKTDTNPATPAAETDAPAKEEAEKIEKTDSSSVVPVVPPADESKKDEKTDSTKEEQKIDDTKEEQKIEKTDEAKDDKKAEEAKESNEFELDENGAYTVKKGDCVWNIAKAYLVTSGQDSSNSAIWAQINKIMDANPNLKWRSKGDIEKYFIDIFVGNKIIIPDAKKTEKAEKTDADKKAA